MAGSGAFPKVAGDTVFANDYNTIYNSLAGIIGVGSGTSGYGAATPMVSGSINQYTSIDAVAWTNLKDDILLARKHQIGTGSTYNTLVNTTFAPITTKLNTNGEIGIADINLLKTTVDTIVTNKDTAAANQLTKVTGTTTTYSSSWNGAIAHTVTVTFASANDARNFFNAGGYLINELSSNGSSGSSKDNDWEGILDAANGTVYTAEDYRGAANVVIRSQTYGSSYGENYFKAWGHRTSSTTIKLTMLFDDASVIEGQRGLAGSGAVFDESVTLNITSAVNYYKSFDAIVSPTPSSVVGTALGVTRTDTATAGFIADFGVPTGGGTGSYTVTVNNTTISETGTLQFTFTQSGYTPGARNCYYETTIATTASSADFQVGSGALSGTIAFASADDQVIRTFFMNTDLLTEGTELIQFRLYVDSSKSVLLATSPLVQITDSSTGAAGEILTGVGATFTIGATLTYSLSGGTPNSTATYSWVGTKPDGTLYTGLSGGTVTLNGSGFYTASGAFLTGPGTFLFSVTFNATGTTRTFTTVSEVPATLTLVSQPTGLGQDQIRLSVTSNYGFTHSYTTSASAGATFDSVTGNPPTGTLSGGATNALMNFVNPHAATTATCTVSMVNCNPVTLTVAVPASTVVFTISPSTAGDGSPLAITFSGGSPNEEYDYFYQSSISTGSYRAIGNHPPYSDAITAAAVGWGGLPTTGQLDAKLTSSGTKSIPFHGTGLFPADYRLWVRFATSGDYRFKDFTVTNNGAVEVVTLSAGTWTNGSGSGDTSVATTISVSGLNTNEIVDIRAVPRYFNYTSTFFSNHGSGWVQNFALSNSGSSYTNGISKGAMYQYGITGAGQYEFWLYFQSTGHYRAILVTVT